ncbi:OprO/OprP family phosphate-selective porin [bacterium]|nr:OprO/OprP family phosphate-selective porin [bacterium]
MTLQKPLLYFYISIYCFFCSFFFSFTSLHAQHITNINAGYKDGFYLATQDEKYSMKLGGRLNFLYSSAVLEQTENIHRFDVLHGKIYLGGHAYSQNIEYFLQTAFGEFQDTSPRFKIPSESIGQQMRLEDFYVRLKQGSYYLQLGQFKVPFSRQALIYSGNLVAPFRNHVNNAFTLRRSQGLMLSHYKPTFHMSAAAFNNQNPIALDNGSPQYPVTQANNNRMLYVGRIGIAPKGYVGFSEGDVEDSQVGKMELNGSIAFSQNNSVYVNNDDTIDLNNADSLSINSDFIWKKKGLALQAEYYYRKLMPDTGSDIKSWGFYIQPSVFVVPSQLELAGLYARSSLNNQIEDTAIETGGGVNIYFSKNHRHKLQTRYTLKQYDDQGQNQKDHWINIALQVSL